MRHFTRLADLGVAGLDTVLSAAEEFKHRRTQGDLRDKVLGMVFFNPSLRTRTSFETAMLRSGGHALALEVGQGIWNLETRDGAIMNNDKPEHIRDAVRVLARYVDAIAVRTFASLADDDVDMKDDVINGFRAFSSVPVISMESGREHPCQGVADLLTVRDRFGKTQGLPVTLTWAPHVKSLPKAVPHSFLLTASAAGCEVRIVHPSGFDLHPEVMAEARQYANQSGGSITIFDDQEAAIRGSRVVYAKAWGPATRQIARDKAGEHVHGFPDWQITPKTLSWASPEVIFMHCLPVRRNVEVADAVLEGARSYVVEQAENRLYAQQAILESLLPPRHAASGT